jgi:hypothetical protein
MQFFQLSMLLRYVKIWSYCVSEVRIGYEMFNATTFWNYSKTLNMVWKWFFLKSWNINWNIWVYFCVSSAFRNRQHKSDKNVTVWSNLVRSKSMRIWKKKVEVKISRVPMNLEKTDYSGLSTTTWSCLEWKPCDMQWVGWVESAVSMKQMEVFFVMLRIKQMNTLF